MTPAVYLLLVNVLLTPLILGYGLLLRRTGWFTSNRVLLWLLVLIAAWLPLADLPEFRPHLLQSVIRQTGSVFPRSLLQSMPGKLAHPTLPTRLLMRSTAPPPFGIATLINWLYGIGVVVLLIRFGWQLLALNRLIRQLTQSSDAGIRLVNNPSVRAPFSFFNYIVLNPDLYTADELNQILQHEKWHCRYGHSVDRLASEVLQISLWMNPLMWWHGQLVRENLEYQVDRAMLQTGNKPKDYQYNLLAVSLLAQPLRLVNSFSRLHLTDRIRMMNRRQSLGAALVLMTLFGLITGAIILAWPTAQHKLLDKPLSRFAVARGNQTYFVIVPTADAADLQGIQQTARGRRIEFEIAPAVLRDSKHKIKQISLGVRPATRVQAPWVSLKAGTPYGQRPISPLGVRCDPAACTVIPVDQTFPVSLRELARRESSDSPPVSSAGTGSQMSKANVQYGLYETYFLEDMIESSFFGLRAMLLRIRPDKHLDLYDENRDVVIIWDRREISRAELQQIRVTEVMKLSVYKGNAAVARLGSERARPGLLVLSKHPDPAQAEAFAENRYLYR